jgi:hypothetical protein
MDWETAEQCKVFEPSLNGDEPPRPLGREPEPAEPFPVDALGNILGPAARGIQERVQAPLAICGQSALAVATLAVQGHADVQLPTGARVPISNYYVTVAATGERKTAVDREAMWPVRKHEDALRETHEINLAIYQNDRDVHEKVRSGILVQAKDKATTKDSIRADLDALGKPPTPPLTPMLTCPEPTFEGLTRLLAGGQPSMGIFSGEGGQFLGGHGMNQDNRLKTAAAMSSLWDGEPIRRVRQGDGSMILPGRRVSMHLMVQPGVAAKLFSSRELADQGLLSRVLPVAPDPASGTRFWRDPSPESDSALKRFGARILEFLEAPLPMAEGKENELAPNTLVLSPEARELWIKFVNHVESHLGPEGDLRNISGLANKLPEHAARIAGVIALVDDLNRAEVPAEHMERGVVLALYYAAEALRLFEVGQVDHQLAIAQRLLDWLDRSWGEDLVSLPDIYQRGLNSIPDQKTARRIVGVLEDHGWLFPVEGGAVMKGQRRQEVWRIVKAPA